MKNIYSKFENAVTIIARGLNWIAGLSLVIMVILTVIDVLGTKFLKAPLPGGIEMVSLMSVLAISFAIAHTQIAHGHIEVEMLVEKLPEPVRKVIATFVYLLGIALFIILSFKSFSYGNALQSSGEVSMTLQIPYFPFVYAISISGIAVALVLAVQLIRIWKKE